MPDSASTTADYNNNNNYTGWNSTGRETSRGSGDAKEVKAEKVDSWTERRINQGAPADNHF